MPWNEEFQVRGAEVRGHCHFLFTGGRGATLVVVPESLRLGDLDVIVLSHVLGVGLPIAMRRLVLVHQEEGFAVVPFFLQPLESLVGDDIGRVAGVMHLAVGGVHPRVVVRALALQHMPVVESGRRGAEMPFSDNGRLVTGSLEQLGHRLLVGIELIAVATKAVQVTVLAGENHGPRWPADGVGDEAAVESHAFVGQPVDIGRLVAIAPVAAHRLIGVVIAHDKEDVGPGRLLARRLVSLGLGLRGQEKSRREESQEKAGFTLHGVRWWLRPRAGGEAIC